MTQFRYLLALTSKNYFGCWWPPGALTKLDNWSKVFAFSRKIRLFARDENFDCITALETLKTKTVKIMRNVIELVASRLYYRSICTMKKWVKSYNELTAWIMFKTDIFSFSFSLNQPLNIVFVEHALAVCHCRQIWNNNRDLVVLLSNFRKQKELRDCFRSNSMPIEFWYFRFLNFVWRETSVECIDICHHSNINLLILFSAKNSCFFWIEWFGDWSHIHRQVYQLFQALSHLKLHESLCVGMWSHWNQMSLKWYLRRSINIYIALAGCHARICHFC